MAGRFSVEAVFRAVDRVTAPVSRMQNRVGRLTRSMGNGFDRLNRQVGRFASGVKKGALAVTAALALSTGAMANVINTGADFEQTLVAAAAKFPGEIRKGTEAFEQLEQAARKTGSATEFSASEAAGAINFLAMAGFDAESSVAALPGVVDLATAAQIDLATATDVASDSLGAFGLLTKDSAQLGRNLARVNDVIAKTTTSANTTVETLFETIKDGGPVATTAGASLETFAALAGELANAGIKGSRAGTTLKNMFLTLAAPKAGPARILQRLGIQTQDASGDMRDIVDILGDLNGALDGLGTAERSGVLEGIFGKIPIAGVNVLLASGSARLREYRGVLEGASGASSTMASVMRDTLQGRLNSLNSAVEGVKISIFRMANGPLADVIDKTTEWVRANEQLIATNVGKFLAGIISNFENIVKWAKRIGIALAVFFALATILKTLVLVMTAVNLVMAANPIVLIVLGIMALIAAIAAAIIWWDELKEAFLGLSGPVKEAIAVIMGPIDRVIGAAALIMDNWEPIKGFFSDLWSGVVGIFAAAIIWWDKIREAMISFATAVIGPIAAMAGPIDRVIGAAALIMDSWEPIKGFFSDLWSGVVGIFDAAVAKIMGVVDKVKGVASFIGGMVSSAGASVSDFFSFGESTGPQVASPQERVARSIDEERTTQSAEVTIRDESGRAEVTGGTLGPGLTLQNSGAF